MPFHCFKRQGFFAVSIAVFGLAAQPSLASPASDLLDKYNAWYLESGFEKAAYAEVIENGDTTEIRDYNVAGTFTIKDDEGEPSVTFYADVTIPRMVFKGATVSGDVYSYDSLAVGKASFEIGLLDEDNTPKDVAGARALEPTVQFSGSVTAYAVSDFSEKWVDRPVLKDGIDQDVFLQLLGLSLNSSYGSSAMDELKLTFNVANEFVSDTVLTNFKTGAIKDGVTQNISIESYSSTGSSSVGTDNVSSNVTSETVTTYRNLQIDKLDTRPLLAFFNVADAPSANYIGKYSAEDIVMDMSIEGASSYEPFSALKLTAASTTAEDLSIEGGDGLKLLAVLEQLKAKPDQDQESLIIELFDALGTYNLGYADMKDLSVQSWDPVRAKRMNEVAPNFAMTLASASVSDFTSRGVGSVEFEGFHGAVEGDDAIFDVASLELADLTWPGLQSIIENAGALEHDPNAALSLMPTIGKFSIKGVEALTDDLDTPVYLGEYTAEMSNHIGPIPTQISEVLDQLSFDAALLKDPMVLGVLERLGIDRVTINHDFDIAWDEETEDLSLENFYFELKNGLIFRANIHLGGIPRSLFTNPDQAEAVIALATFKGAEIELSDSPLVSEAIATQAEKAGIPSEMLVTMMLDGILQEAGPIADTQFAAELVAAVEEFAANPEGILITMEPENAVPVMQLGGLAALAPQELPKLLGAAVYTAE